MEITLKKETLLGLESHDALGFKTEEELELEISKLIKNTIYIKTLLNILTNHI